MAKGQEQGAPWLWLHSPEAADGQIVGGAAALTRALLWSDKTNQLPQTAVLTTVAYRAVGADGLARLTRDATRDLAPHDVTAIHQASVRLTRAWQRAVLPKSVTRAVSQVWQKLGKSADSLTVRPSPVQWANTASTVAEQYVTIDHIKNEAALAAALRRVWASGFSEAALTWRLQHGLDPAGFDLAVAVQASAGRGGWLYPIDPMLHSSAVWCAETEAAQARVFVPTRAEAAVIESITEIPDAPLLRLIEKMRPVAANKSVRILWAKDGKELIPVWATTWPQSTITAVSTTRYELKKTGPVIATGTAYGTGIAAGVVAVIDGSERCPAGAIAVVAELTPRVMNALAVAAGVICEEPGVSGYAAALVREYGIPAVSGVPRARAVCKKAGTVTIANQTDGSALVYQGVLPFEVHTESAVESRRTKTALFAVVTQPERVVDVAALPATGAEFPLEFGWSTIGTHPLALLRGPNRTTRTAKAVNDLATGIARVAAAFYPRPVHVRLSSFGSAEFAALDGGKANQDAESSGRDVQGAGRYLTPEYGPVFALECEALQRVRAFGLTNVQPILPFCRTPDEAKAVRALAEKNGLTTKAGWEMAVACTIPANVILARDVVRTFDGLYLDVSEVIDNRTNRQWLRQVIAAGRRARKPVHAAGHSLVQNKTLLQFLLQQKITSLTVLPDAVVSAQREIRFIEQTVGRTGNRTSLKALGLVIGAGLIAASLLGLGAGCSRTPAELPVGTSDISPAELRTRLEARTNATLARQAAEFAASTTTLKISTFANFAITHPRLWNTDYRPESVTFTDPATGATATISRQGKTRQSVTSTPVTGTPYTARRYEVPSSLGPRAAYEIILPDNSLLEISGDTNLVDILGPNITFE